MAELGLINTQDEIEELEGFETDEVKQAWKIKDLSGADWAFRKLQEIDKELEEKVSYAKNEKAKYDKYIKDEEKAAEERKGFFSWKLEEFLRSQREHDPKYKIKTAQGQANYKNSKKWKYDDNTILKFLEENELEDFIRIKKEVNKDSIKKAVTVTESGSVVTEDGEIIEGITVTDEQTLTLKY